MCRIVDAVSHYLHNILTPRLRGYGVSERFLPHVMEVVRVQMLSLLRHWDDRAFRNTVLLLGLEEGSFYEPPARLDIRCFVVVAIRNSPIETLQSAACGEAGLVRPLPDRAVQEITAEAIRYFSGQDPAKLCAQAKLDGGRDLYQELMETHPVAWAALRQLAATASKSVDYPRVPVSEPYDLKGVEQEPEGDAVSGELKVGVYDGYIAEIEPPLRALLKMLSADPNGVLIVDSFKSVTRNAAKLLDILEFLLTRDLAFASANCYMENGHVERRVKPLRAGHGRMEMEHNLSNTTGLGYRHRSALRRYAGQDN